MNQVFFYDKNGNVCDPKRAVKIRVIKIENDEVTEMIYDTEAANDKEE